MSTATEIESVQAVNKKGVNSAMYINTSSGEECLVIDSGCTKSLKRPDTLNEFKICEKSGVIKFRTASSILYTDRIGVYKIPVYDVYRKKIVFAVEEFAEKIGRAHV